MSEKRTTPPGGWHCLDASGRPAVEARGRGRGAELTVRFRRVADGPRGAAAAEQMASEVLDALRETPQYRRLLVLRQAHQEAGVELTRASALVREAEAGATNLLDHAADDDDVAGTAAGLLYTEDSRAEAAQAVDRWRRVLDRLQAETDAATEELRQAAGRFTDDVRSRWMGRTAERLHGAADRLAAAAGPELDEVFRLDRELLAIASPLVFSVLDRLLARLPAAPAPPPSGQVGHDADAVDVLAGEGVAHVE